MTDLARLMFNCTRAVSMAGAKTILDALGPEGAPMAQSQKGAPASLMPMPSMPISSMPMPPMMEALFPLFWLKLAAGLLYRREHASPMDHPPMASVLDRAPALLEPPPAPKSLPSAAVPLPTQSTGWGPMP